MLAIVTALFGITCVGKTTIGKIIGERLGYEFYDLDAEIKSFYDDTLTNIYSDCICRHAIDSKKVIVLDQILNKCADNAIIAISPIYYTKLYKTMLLKKRVFSIVLNDTPENIANRLIHTDDNDEVMDVLETDKKQDTKDIRYFTSRYKNAYSKIDCHYFINGKTASEAADEIITMINSRDILPG